MALFKRKDMGQAELLAFENQKYIGARFYLLIALAFTVVNCILVATGSSTYFLFSCSIPYALVDYGFFACGLMLSPEDYLEYGWTEMDFWPIELLYVLIGMAAACVLLYLVCWIFSKKQVGWMVAVTVFFAIDTVFLFLWYEIGWDMIVDYLFHAWVMYSLIRGLVGHFRAKKLAKHPAE